MATNQMKPSREAATSGLSSVMSIPRTWLLTRLMVGGTRLMASGVSSKPKTPMRKLGTGLAFAFLIVYMLGIVGFMAYQLASVLQMVGMAELFPGLLITGCALMSILFGIYYLISVFYHSDETTYIVSLPFRTTELVGAKFLQTLAFEYLLVLMIFMPASVAYGIATVQDVGYYLMILPIAVLLPVVPLALITVLMMLLMRVIPFAKNKDRITTIMNIVILVVVLAFSFAMSRPMSEEELLDLLLGSGAAGGLIEVSQVGRFIPGMTFAVRAMGMAGRLEGWLWLLAFAAVGVLAFAIVVWVGRFTYLETLLSMASGGGTKKALSGESLKSASRGRSAYLAYTAKEMRLLLRTPAFLMNNVLASVVMPFFVLVTPLLYGNPSEIVAQLPDLSAWSTVTGEESVLFLAVVAGIAAYQLGFGAVNGIAATAISREGEQAFVMKYLPVSFRTQFLAKLTPGVLISALPILLILPLVYLIMPVPLGLMLVAIALILLTTVLVNVIGLIFDVSMPKLKWENETQAVKNNLNSLWSMLVGFLLCLIPVGLAFGVWHLGLSALWLGLSLIVVLIGLTVLTWFVLLRVGVRKILQADW